MERIGEDILVEMVQQCDIFGIGNFWTSSYCDTMKKAWKKKAKDKHDLS